MCIIGGLAMLWSRGISGMVWLEWTRFVAGCVFLFYMMAVFGRIATGVRFFEKREIGPGTMAIDLVLKPVGMKSLLKMNLMEALVKIPFFALGFLGVVLVYLSIQREGTDGFLSLLAPLYVLILVGSFSIFESLYWNRIVRGFAKKKGKGTGLIFVHDLCMVAKFFLIISVMFGVIQSTHDEGEGTLWAYFVRLLLIGGVIFLVNFWVVWRRFGGKRYDVVSFGR